MNLKEGVFAIVVLTLLPRFVIVAVKEYGDIMPKGIRLQFFVTTAIKLVIHTVRIADD